MFLTLKAQSDDENVDELYTQTCGKRLSRKWQVRFFNRTVNARYLLLLAIRSAD